MLRAESRQRAVRYDIVKGLSELVDGRDDGSKILLASGLEYEECLTNTYTILADDPLSAHIRHEHLCRLGCGDWQTRTETSSTMSADAESFYVTNVLDAYEGDTRIFTKTWHFKVARDLV